MKLKEKLKDLSFQSLIVKDNGKETSYEPPYSGIERDLLERNVIGYEEKVIENKYIIELGARNEQNRKQDSEKAI